MSFFERDSRTIHYQFFASQEPQAPLVIYLHGLLMDNLSSGYFTFTNELKSHAHVLLFDLHGHGRSSFSQSGYRLDDHLADVKGLIQVVEKQLYQKFNEHYTSPKITLIGCSFGGILALHCAQKIPQINSIIMLEGHIGTPKFLTQLSQDLQATGSTAVHLIEQHFKHWLHRGSERKRRRLLDRTQRLVYESSLIADLNELDDEQVSSLDSDSDSFNLMQQSIQLATDICFIYGKNSDAYLEAVSFYQRRLPFNPKDRFHSFDRCTHALLWEATAEVTQTIVGWMKRDLDAP